MERLEESYDAEVGNTLPGCRLAQSGKVKVSCSLGHRST